MSGKDKKTSATSWQDSLQDFLAANPDLPAGEEPIVAEPENPSQKGRLDVMLDKKGRKGKTATIVAGWELPDEEVEEIASQMKRKLGIGGSARGGEILLQGDVRAQALDWLKAKGYKARQI